MNDFIEEYSAVVSKEECQTIIDWFESNTHLHRPGIVGNDKKVDLTAKDSTDIHMDFFNTSYNQIHTIILKAIDTCLRHYKEKYHYLDNIDPWGLFDGYNIQRYYPGQGYPAIHSEAAGRGEGSESMLVWTLYLNDVTDDGGTMFPYQKRIISANAGNFLLFPAPWTHMHHGIISKTQIKYIATGWFNYNE